MWRVKIADKFSQRTITTFITGVDDITVKSDRNMRKIENRQDTDYLPTNKK